MHLICFYFRNRKIANPVVAARILRVQSFSKIRVVNMNSVKLSEIEILLKQRSVNIALWPMRRSQHTITNIRQ